MLTRHCIAFIAFHIGLAILPFVTVPALFAESLNAEAFNSRPLQSELETTVAFGIACARGVHERCYATQTSTNPTYSVNPPEFAGTNGGWYLNNNLMSDLDLKAKALVPCYVDDNTIYSGTTNIAMLTTNGLWATLQIGDKTNQFTGTPAIGTNPPTYGDYPWRIYVEEIKERYKVLYSLSKIVLPASTVRLHKSGQSLDNVNGWSDCLSEAELNYQNSDPSNAPTYSGDVEASYAATWSEPSGQTPYYRLTISKTSKRSFNVSSLFTNIHDCFMEVKAYMRASAIGGFGDTVFDANGVSGLTSNLTWDLIKTYGGPFSYNQELKYVDIGDSLPAACNDPHNYPFPDSSSSRGFYSPEGPKAIAYFDFHCCTDAY